MLRHRPFPLHRPELPQGNLLRAAEPCGRSLSARAGGDAPKRRHPPFRSRGRTRTAHGRMVGRRGPSGRPVRLDDFHRRAGGLLFALDPGNGHAPRRTTGMGMRSGILSGRRYRTRFSLGLYVWSGAAAPAGGLQRKHRDHNGLAADRQAGAHAGRHSRAGLRPEALRGRPAHARRMLAHGTFAHDTRRTALPHGLAPGARRGGFMARSRRPNPFRVPLHPAPRRLVRSFQTRRLRHLRAERGTRPAAFPLLAHRPDRGDLPLRLRRFALALAHGALRRPIWAASSGRRKMP